MTFTRILLVLLFAASALASPTPTPSATPKPSYRFSVDKGAVTLRDAKSGAVLGSTTIERWGRPASTQDQLRHVALDATATAVAGDRMGRERRGGKERMVDPNSPVYTIADKAPYATVTFEKGIGFILLSDTYVNGHYEALIQMLKAGEWSTSQPVWGNLGQEKDVPLDYKKAAELYEAGKKLAYPKNKEDYDALPSGALYLDPGDGLIYQRKKH